jgi:hypothetical protein
MNPFAPGTRVRLSGKFLASTGQRTGRAGLDRWTVRACVCDLCARGDFVCTDEMRDPAYLATMWTREEIAAHPSLAWRHINRANLTIVGRLSSRDCV